MALLWVEGFEQYAVGADMERAAQGVSASFSSFSLGRDDRGLACNLGVSSSYYTIPVNPDDDVTYTIGFAFKITSLSNRDLVNIRMGESNAIDLELQSDGEIEMTRSFTQVAVSSGLGITTGQWYYLEWEIYVHDTLGTYDLKINGATVFSGTNTDTKATTTTSPVHPSGIMIVGSSSGDHFIDDVYLIDDTGLTNNSFLGDCIVETLYPDGDGTTNDFTPLSGLTNYEMVDDGGTPDTGTTYVASSTVNHIDLYTFGNLVEEVDTIYGVHVGAMHSVMSAGPRQVRVLTRTGGVNYESDALGCAASYTHTYGLWEDNPNTAAAWTEANFNGAEFGFTIEA